MPGRDHSICTLDDIGVVDWNKREDIVKNTLPKVKDQFIYLKFIEGVAEGEKTKVLLQELDIHWSVFSNLYRKKPELYQLYVQSKERGEEYRQLVREDEADRRAVEGTLKPQFHKGEICGYVREYSDSMLALQLKAGDRDKYADRQQVDMKGVVLTVNTIGVKRAPIEVKEEKDK